MNNYVRFVGYFGFFLIVCIHTLKKKNVVEILPRRKWQPSVHVEGKFAFANVSVVVKIMGPIIGLQNGDAISSRTWFN